MSAFIVDDNHIRILVDIAVRGPVERLDNDLHTFSYYHMSPEVKGRNSVTEENADDIFAMLIQENIKSFRYRYEDRNAEEYSDRPFSGYWTPLYRPTAVESLKVIDCYEYQSCEHPGWKSSEAHSFCTSLRKYVIGFLPGYEDAPWQWTKS